MVHNTFSTMSLPFRGQVMRRKGCGMGSVLLQKGGPGSASSYIDIDDYIQQTNRDPFKSGKGIKGLSELTGKLQKLNVNPQSNIRGRNITMN